MRAYLRLRLLVLGRLLAEVGWVRLLLLGGMLIVAAGKLLELLLAKPQLQWAAPALGLSLSWSGYRQRTDLDFLPIVSPRYKTWLSVESALLLGPVWGLLLGLGHFGAALATVAAGLLGPFLPLGRKSATQRRRRSLFRSDAFEWVSGFRRPVLGLGWLAAVGAAAWQHATVVPAGALLAWSLLLTTLYAIPEPSTMVTGYRGPVAFGRRKLLLALGLYLLTALPLLGLAGLSPAGWGGTLGALLWSLLVLSLSILAKYAFYPHATLLRLTQAGAITMALLPLLDAAYAPLLAAALGGLLWKSRKRLQLYWHA
ncbi:hypothetical protein [Hymenobacter chitinivorans]|uniref:Uncharacterized protein n=1 Tax=Hymenobacter chitinivorans DSM 11115 TaxID=1121954 RepID=A0A2M9BQ97_9BACT|nr:hypothetical protein [Hymenobacter chitinivorans]PJJ60124.1 hypothetical protein CLV45_1549 [Hymenobacter chitinivorans DSM 11115]